MHAPPIDRREALHLRLPSNEDAEVERFVSDGGSMATPSQRAPAAAPSEGERAVMATHGIQFDGSGFRFAGCRYARLIDALHQSRRAGQGCE